MEIFTGHVNNPSAVTTVGFTTTIRSLNLNHVGHGAESVVDIIIMKKVETCKKWVKTDQLPLPQIYREALSENNKILPELIAQVIPKFENKNMALCLEGDKIHRNYS